MYTQIFKKWSKPSKCSKHTLNLKHILYTQIFCLSMRYAMRMKIMIKVWNRTKTTDFRNQNNLKMQFSLKIGSSIITVIPIMAKTINV